MSKELYAINHVIGEFSSRSKELFSFASSYKCRGAIVCMYSSMIELISRLENMLIFVPKDEFNLYVLTDKHLHECVKTYNPDVSFVLHIIVCIDKNLHKQDLDDGICHTSIMGKDLYTLIPPVYDKNGNELKGNCVDLKGDECIDYCKNESKDMLHRAWCNNCNTKLKRYMKCSICLSVAYCNKECQINDWKIIKLYVKLLTINYK